MEPNLEGVTDLDLKIEPMTVANGLSAIAFVPLLYVAGTRTPSEPLTFPVEGVDGGSVSMLAVQVG